MDENRPTLSHNTKTRFLANINAEDSMKKSQTLLEEILGRKLDQLKIQNCALESSDKKGNSQTRAPETNKAEENLMSPLNAKSLPEKQEDCTSLTAKAKTSMKQSQHSKSQLGSMVSGSLQKRMKSAEKDQVNITTQDGNRSDKNSEAFDLRLFRVPNGVVRPLDSISQQSGEQRPGQNVERDLSPEINHFEKGVPVQNPESEASKAEFRRSVTDAHFQDLKKALGDVNLKDSEEALGLNEFSTKARRTPTDGHIDGGRKKSITHRDKPEAWKVKANMTGYKLSPMKSEAEGRNVKFTIPMNKVLPQSSGRAMLEFHNPVACAVSENIFSSESSKDPRKRQVGQSKEKSSEVRETMSSGDLIKGCLKKDPKRAQIQLSEAEEYQSSRNFALASPTSSKKGILTNKSKAIQLDPRSSYDMSAGVKRTNTQMSKKQPIKVRFSDKPIIYEVESYKRYYKEQFSERECCSSCSLI